MKKILLTFVAAAFAVAGFSQPAVKWTGSIQAHEESVGINDWNIFSPISAAEDGSVYMTGSFDQDLTIGSDVLDHTGMSSFLARYSNTGEALWAVSFNGAAAVTAISSFDDGVVLAGVFAGDVILGSKDGNTRTISGMADNDNAVSAFILRYDANGNLKAVKAIVPEINIDLQMEALMSDIMYFPEPMDTYILPNQIEKAGDSIYVSVSYTSIEKISDNLTLTGKVLNVWDFMYMDITSAAIISFDLNLTDAALVYDVATADADHIGYMQMQPESLRFAVSNGKVYAAGSGFGSLEVTGQKSGIMNFDIDDFGNIENGMFIIDPENGIKEFHATPTDRMNTDSEINYISVKDNIMRLVGTYSACLPFDNTKTESSYNETFVAMYDLNSQTVRHALTSGTEKGENELEIVTGAKFEENTTWVTTVVFCDKYDNQSIVKGISLNASDAGITANSNSIITAMDGKVANDFYAVSAKDGAYTISLMYDDPASVNRIKAEDGIVRKELVGGRIFLVKNGIRYNLLGVEQQY